LTVRRGLEPSATQKARASRRPQPEECEKCRRPRKEGLSPFFGYALWVAMKHLLLRKRLLLTPGKALAPYATIQSAAIVLPAKDSREIRLRQVTTSSAGRKQLLEQLGVLLPVRSVSIRNVVQTQRLSELTPNGSA
jgi:hypothetical protein